MSSVIFDEIRYFAGTFFNSKSYPNAKKLGKVGYIDRVGRVDSRIYPDLPLC